MNSFLYLTDLVCSQTSTGSTFSKKRLITYIDFCLITKVLEASLTMTELQLSPPKFLWPPIRLLYLSLKRKLLQSLSLGTCRSDHCQRIQTITSIWEHLALTIRAITYLPSHLKCHQCSLQRSKGQPRQIQKVKKQKSWPFVAI